MRYGRLTMAALCMLLCTQVARAAFHRGDILVAGVDVSRYPEVTGRIRQYSQSGTFIAEILSQQTALGGGPGDLQFSPLGVLHALDSGMILRFASDGSQLPPFTSPYTGGSLSFAVSGDLFTAANRVAKLDRNGVLQWTDSLSPYGAGLASRLDADQCTFYYLHADHIRKYDVCTRADAGALPPVLPGEDQLVALADGTLLISTALSEVYRVARDGSILRHYATHAFVFAPDSDPCFAWVAVPNTNGGIAKFDLQNDSFAWGPFETGMGAIGGIAIVTSDPANVPAFSPMMLAALACALGAFAIIRLRAI